MGWCRGIGKEFDVFAVGSSHVGNSHAKIRVPKAVQGNVDVLETGNPQDLMPSISQWTGHF